MRALIALLCWLALSGPLALLVSRLIGATSGNDGVGDEAERWLRSLVPPRRRMRDTVLRSALAVIVLAPAAVGALAALWRLPDAVTVAQADGQLALSWPPGQPDRTTTTTSAPEPAVVPDAVPSRTTMASRPSTSSEATTTDPAPPAPSGDPAPPPDAGGGDTGAPALADEDPDGEAKDDDKADRCAEHPADEASSKDERCEEPGDGSTPAGGDGGGDAGVPHPDDGDGEDGEPATTTTEPPPPPPADEKAAAMVPVRSSTALLTGTR